MGNEKRVKVKCMKRVDGTKDRFNWIENYEIYYEEELLRHLEPPYPTKLNVKQSVYIREKEPANQHQILSCRFSWNFHYL